MRGRNVLTGLVYLQNRRRDTEHQKDYCQQADNEIFVIFKKLRRLFTAIAGDFGTREKTRRFNCHFIYFLISSTLSDQTRLIHHQKHSKMRHSIG